MDPWKELAARAECRDAVRKWAELEGKSPLMTEHLLQTCSAPSSGVLDKSIAIATGLRLTTWLLETWWYVVRR
jgi:hypothetical protein